MIHHCFGRPMFDLFLDHEYRKVQNRKGSEILRVRTNIEWFPSPMLYTSRFPSYSRTRQPSLPFRHLELSFFEALCSCFCLPLQCSKYFSSFNTKYRKVRLLYGATGYNCEYIFIPHMPFPFDSDWLVSYEGQARLREILVMYPFIFVP